MDFDLRAISLTETAVNITTRWAPSEFMGREFEFRKGISVRLTLPKTIEGFRNLPDPDRLLTALDSWSRVYQFPIDHDGTNEFRRIHVLALTDASQTEEDEIQFYRLDFRQPLNLIRTPRSPVEILGGSVMSHSECLSWLVSIAEEFANVHPSKRTTLTQPPYLKVKKLRLGWVGPERIGQTVLPRRLASIGAVVGAEILHIAPIGFPHVRARLASLKPLDAVVLCTGHAPYLSEGVVPSEVPSQLVLSCGSRDIKEIEKETLALIELAEEERSHTDEEGPGEGTHGLLRLMVRAMLSHSKIGQFNHCPLPIVLKCIRARRLNVRVGERVLHENAEGFQDTKTSDRLFLWKEHHDGRQYFLNPTLVEAAKQLCGAP